MMNTIVVGGKRGFTDSLQSPKISSFSVSLRLSDTQSLSSVERPSLQRSLLLALAFLSLTRYFSKINSV